MTLFGQKTDTSKVDSIVNNHLRRLLETPVAQRSKEEIAAPEAMLTSAAEPSPAASDATAVAFVDASVVVATEAPAVEPMPEVVVEPMSVSSEVAKVAVYMIAEPVAVEPAPAVIAEPVIERPMIEPPAVVCAEQSEPAVVEPVAEPIVAPVVAPVAVAEIKAVETKVEVTPAVAEVASSLANDLARCLVGAFQNLQQNIVVENQKFSSSLMQQIERLQSSVDGVAQLRQPVAELASAISEQRTANAANLEQCHQLSTAVASLEQSHTRNNTELVTLRIEQLEMRSTVGAHADDLAILKGSAGETARRVALMNDVMDRQSSVLRQLHEVETRRAAALERAFESLNRTAHEPVRLAIPA